MGANEDRWSWIFSAIFIILVWLITAVALFY